MPDIRVGPIKLTGDFCKFPQLGLGYLLIDDVTGEDVMDRQTGSKDALLFPDCVDSLTDNEKIDLFYYIRQWFINRDIDILKDQRSVEQKDYDGSKTTIDTTLKGVLTDAVGKV